MPDTDLLKWFATMGVGGVLAGFMFMFYRKDVKQYTELWRIQSDKMLDVVIDNTKAITTLSNKLDGEIVLTDKKQ